MLKGRWLENKQDYIILYIYKSEGIWKMIREKERNTKSHNEPSLI